MIEFFYFSPIAPRILLAVEERCPILRLLEVAGGSRYEMVQFVQLAVGVCVRISRKRG